MTKGNGSNDVPASEGVQPADQKGDNDSNKSTNSNNEKQFGEYVELGVRLFGGLAGAAGVLYALGFLVVNISLLSYGVYELSLLRERYVSAGVAFILFVAIIAIYWSLIKPEKIWKYFRPNSPGGESVQGLQMAYHYLQYINAIFFTFLILIGALILISFVITALVVFIWKTSYALEELVEVIAKLGEADFRGQRWLNIRATGPVFVWCALVSLIFIVWRFGMGWGEEGKTPSQINIAPPTNAEKGNNGDLKQGDEDSSNGKWQLLLRELSANRSYLFVTILLFFALVVYARNVFPELPAAMGGGLPIVVQFSGKEVEELQELSKLGIPVEEKNSNLTQQINLIAQTGNSYIVRVYNAELKQDVAVSIPRDHLEGIIYYPGEYFLVDEFVAKQLTQQGGEALKQGHYQTAIEKFKEAMGRKKDYAPALIGLGDAYVEQCIANKSVITGDDCDIDKALERYKEVVIQACAQILGNQEKLSTSEAFDNRTQICKRFINNQGETGQKKNLIAVLLEWPAKLYERFFNNQEERKQQETEAEKRLSAEALYQLSRVYALLISKQTLGLSLSTLNNPFFVTLRDGAQVAADAAGVNLTVVDAQDDPDREANNIEDLIQQGVDAILVNPTDAHAVVPSVRKANEARIPVFTIDRAAKGGIIVSHIASDNVAGGAEAAKFLCDALGGQGKVVELEGIVGSSAARDRGLGFNNYMSSECSGVEIIARQTANFDRAEGLSVFENILQAQPVINGTFAHNDEMILGAIQAAEAAGRKGEIIFVGFDATDDAVNAVNEGKLAATVAQQPALMGQLGVDIAMRSLGGKAVESYKQIDLFLVQGTPEPKELEFIRQVKSRFPETHKMLAERYKLIINSLEKPELEKPKREKNELDFLKIHCPEIEVNDGDPVDYMQAITATLECAIKVDKESEDPKNYAELAKSDHIFHLVEPIKLRTDDNFIGLLFPSMSPKEVVRRLSMELADLQELSQIETAIDHYTWAIIYMQERDKCKLYELLKEEPGFYYFFADNDIQMNFMAGERCKEMPRLYFNRARLYLDLHGKESRQCEDGDCLGKAIADYEKAVTLEPKNATYLTSLADAQRMESRLEKAVNTYNKVTGGIDLEEESGYALAWLGLGEVYLSQEKNQEAKEAFGRAIECQPGNAAAYYDRAIAEARIGKDLVQAIRDLREAIKLEEAYYLQKAHDEPVFASLIDPNNLVAARQKFEAGQIDTGKNKLEDALQKYQEACELDPHNDAYHAAVAKAYLELPEPNWDGAEQAYLKAIELFPENDNYYDAYLELPYPDWDGAEQAYLHAIELYPKIDIHHFKLGEEYAKQGEYELAEKSFTTALKLSQDNGENDNYHFRLGEVYAAQVKYHKAIESFNAAIVINGRKAIYHDRLSAALFKIRLVSEAISKGESAKQLEPENLDYRFHLAEIYRQIKSWNRAIINYNQILKRNPEYGDGYCGLSMVYYQSGEAEGAEAAYQRCQQLGVNDDLKRQAEAEKARFEGR